MARKRKEKWRVRRQESELEDLERQILEAAYSDLQEPDGDFQVAAEAFQAPGVDSASMPAVKLAVTMAAAEAIDLLLTDEEIPDDSIADDAADMRGLFSYELEYADELMPTLGIGGSARET
jgi:hypothetical protein